MRTYLVFSLLFAMFTAMVVTVLLRPVTVVRSEQQSIAALADAGTHDGNNSTESHHTTTNDASSHSGTVASSGNTHSDASTHPDGTTSVARLLSRPLRVTAPGWEFLAPGAVGNHSATPDGPNAFSRLGLEVQFSASNSLDNVNAALARGGDDSNGADIAILSLPGLIANYERLRALDPVIFFVVGWSHGRDGVESSQTDLAQVVSHGSIGVLGKPGDAGVALVLLALELAGARLDRVNLIDPEAPSGYTADIASVDRARSTNTTNTPDSRHLLFSTTDARRFIPYVAVAQTSFVRSHPEVLQAWMRGWLAGAETLRSNVPDGARQIAALNGGPEAVALIERLGLLDTANLRDNARTFGLAGRGAVTLSRLFERTWKLWRAVHVVEGPVPELLPINSTILEAVIRADPGALLDTTHANSANNTGTFSENLPANVHVIINHHGPDLRPDESVLLDDIGFTAGVFENSPLRLNIHGDASQTRLILTSVRDRFDLNSNRLFVNRARSRSDNLVEVYSLP